MYVCVCVCVPLRLSGRESGGTYSVNVGDVAVENALHDFALARVHLLIALSGHVLCGALSTAAVERRIGKCVNVCVRMCVCVAQIREREECFGWCNLRALFLLFLLFLFLSLSLSVFDSASLLHRLLRL